MENYMPWVLLLGRTADEPWQMNRINAPDSN
jgi:hypothetical protein